MTNIILDLLALTLIIFYIIVLQIDNRCKSGCISDRQYRNGINNSSELLDYYYYYIAGLKQSLVNTKSPQETKYTIYHGP